MAAGITANKYVLQFLSPAWFVAIRMSLAGLLLVLYHAKEFTPTLRKRVKNDWMELCVVTICSTLLPSLLKAFGLKYMFAAKSTLLASIDPFVTSIYAYFILGEVITLRKLIGMVFAVAGVVVISLAAAPNEWQFEWFGFISIPEIAVLVAVIITRFGWILATRLMRKEHYTPTQINSIIMLMSAFGAIFIALAEGDSLLGENPITLPAFLVFALSIVACNVIGYAMYARSLKEHNATLVSLSGFLVPIFVAISSYFVLKEPLQESYAISGGLTLIGLLFFYFDKTGKSKDLL